MAIPRRTKITIGTALVFFQIRKDGFEGFDGIDRLSIDGNEDVAGGESAERGPSGGGDGGDEHALEIIRQFLRNAVFLAEIAGVEFKRLAFVGIQIRGSFVAGLAAGLSPAVLLAATDG